MTRGAWWGHNESDMTDTFTFSPSFQISQLLVDDPEFYLAVY